MNEFEVRDLLKSERKEVKTVEDLSNLISKVEKYYNYGYGVAPRAIAQATVATFNYLMDKMGCTGFQASCALWDVIRDTLYTNNKTGMKLINYDDMLYPQYEDKFNKTISKNVWENLQKTARGNLESDKYTDMCAYHWQSIVDGVVPFGYTVEDKQVERGTR